MNTMRAWIGGAAMVCVLCLTALPTLAKTDKRAVLDTYVRIAHAAYADSLASAKTLRTTINVFLSTPSRAGLEAARKAWIASRVPYMQTEVFRFGNPIVDAWEGKVNAWPLDEGMIDYVAGAHGKSTKENPLFAANVIANPTVKLGGKVIDAAIITKTLLAETLHEAGKVEANVATGYHAIEFLLWGQDLNGTGPGAGNRPWTDYSAANCSNANCARRAAYLRAAAELLVDDLTWITAQWALGGKAREGLVRGDANKGIAAMLTGMGSLSYGELAGERMKLGLMLHDPEEEHDCFSDNTHNSHYYDVVGILNVYHGRYVRTDGRAVAGPSLANLVAETSRVLHEEMTERLKATQAAMLTLKKRAEAGEAYDQMIGAKNPAGNAVVDAAIEALRIQTKSIQKIVGVLGLNPIAFEGSDSLDAPEKVFK